MHLGAPCYPVQAGEYNRMQWTILALACSGVFASIFANDIATKPAASAHRALKIDQCFTHVAGGKATLNLGTLCRTNDVFGGAFEMKVNPYFFKNDKGTLAIVITDESIEKASKGMPVDITGTATTAGKNGTVRPIGAVATPVDSEHGALKLWFTVEDRKMVFETKYRFIE